MRHETEVYGHPVGLVVIQPVSSPLSDLLG